MTKFVANSMLGKLAKWLRILGYDVLYYDNLTDDELIDITFKEKRILLTRDKKLSQNWIVKTIFIDSEKKEIQLEELIKKLDLEIEEEQYCRRCPKCNTLLELVNNKELLKEKIPVDIYNKYDEFWCCNKCNKYYWQGPHWTSIKNYIKKLTTN